MQNRNDLQGFALRKNHNVRKLFAGICAFAVLAGGAAVWFSQPKSADAATSFLWTQRTNAGLNSWASIAMSSDGVKLVAASANGYIYTSIDSGATWTQRTAAGLRNWTSVASSSNGTNLVATVGGGIIYVSVDSGATWTARMTDTALTEMRGAAVSGNGIKMAVANGTYNPGGYIDFNKFYSINNGTAWTASFVPGGAETSFSSAAISNDGSKIVMTGNGPLSRGSIYTCTWTVTEPSCTQTSSPALSWTSIAMSSDGTKLIASANASYIYTSVDGGATWVSQTASGQNNWTSVAISGDGLTMIAANTAGVYTSLNGGVNWTREASPGTRTWQSVALSTDGKKAAAVATGSIYIYTAALVSTASAPLNLMAVAGDQQAILSWNPPLDNGGNTITDYQIEYKKSSNATWSIFSHAASANTNATVTGLTNDAIYQFRVSAVTATGVGDVSNVATVDLNPVTEQDVYRVYDNANSLTPGAPLAADNTAASLSQNPLGDATDFRVRMSIANTSPAGSEHRRDAHVRCHNGWPGVLLGKQRFRSIGQWFERGRKQQPGSGCGDCDWRVGG